MSYFSACVKRIATAKGNTVFSAMVRGGFARVNGQSVTVLTPEAEVTLET